MVVGLGNPGPEYSGNRHNVGYLVVEDLVSNESGGFRAHKKARALTWEGRVAAGRVVAAKPTTYMNDSGAAISALSNFYKIGPDRMIIVHDELDLPFGNLRLKFGGGDNGHNGLKSLRKSLGTGDFFRARFGIGRPPGTMDPAAFVLRDFAAGERPEVPILVRRVVDAVNALMADGLDRAQSEFNN